MLTQLHFPLKVLVPQRKEKKMCICVSLCLRRSVCGVKAWDENLGFILYFYNSQVKEMIWSNRFGFVMPVYISSSVFQETRGTQHGLCQRYQSTHSSLCVVSPGFILTCKLGPVHFLLVISSVLIASVACMTYYIWLFCIHKTHLSQQNSLASLCFLRWPHTIIQ